LQGVPKKSPKASESSSKDISGDSLDGEENGKTYFRDATKPVGDACRDDGTLKKASELDWPDSPTTIQPPQEDNMEWYDYEPGMYYCPDDDDLSRTEVNRVAQI
jgi:hypothetical protein